MAVDAPLIFRDFIQNNVQYALSRLPAAADVVPQPEDRQWMLQALDYALAYADAWPATWELVVALAPKMEQVGYRNVWASYLQRGIERSQEQGDGLTEAELRLQLGILHQLLSQYGEARQEIALSLQEFQRIADLHGQARALNRLAYVLRRQGKRDLAGTMARNALGLLAEGDPERGYCHLVFGAIKLDERQWEAAAAHFQSALDIWQRSASPRLRGWGHSNLGLALWRLERYGEAKAHLQQAITLFERCADPVHAAVAVMNLGNILMAEGHTEEALVRYRKARQVFRKTHDQVRLGKIEINLGHAYRRLGAFDPAEAAFCASMKTWRELEQIAQLLNAMGGMAQVYLDQNRYRDTLTLASQALQLLDTVAEEHTHRFLQESWEEVITQAERELRSDGA